MYKVEIIASSLIGSEVDELIEKYPKLNDFGFTVERHNMVSRWGDPYNDDRAFVFLNSLDDLFKLIESTDKVVVDKNDRKHHVGDSDYTLEIYDGWRE